MKRIKWENITFIAMLVYGFVAIALHNFNELTLCEVPVYFTMAFITRYAVKYVRLNTKAFLSEIRNILID